MQGATVVFQELLKYNYLTVAMQRAKVVSQKLLKDNPFTEAMREAETVGKYLAHLLHQGLLFPNCSVSIVGFSLGT